jgi:hypothetical protein
VLHSQHHQDYEASLIEEFDKLLPEKPPWKSGGQELGARGWRLGQANGKSNGKRQMANFKWFFHLPFEF